MIRNKEICIFTPCTRQEYRSGELEQSMLAYFDLQASEIYSFDLVFCFNQKPEKEDEGYKDLFNLNDNDNVSSVEWISLDLDPKEDVYFRPTLKNPDPLKLKSTEPSPIPKYGGSSGPNLSFYKSLLFMMEEQYKSFNHFFMIEIDSYPCSENWMDSIIEVSKKEDFLIAGSRYKGFNKWHYALPYKKHLNGIAIYKNCALLKELIEECLEYHPKMINRKNWLLNFDIVIDFYIRETAKHKWGEHLRLFQDTNIITNVSDPLDSHLSIDDVLDSHPDTVIVHQKTANTKALNFIPKSFYPSLDLDFHRRESKIPIFLHFPRCGGTSNIAWATTFFHEYCRKLDLEIINKDRRPTLRTRRVHCNIGGVAEIIAFVYDKSLCLYNNPNFKGGKMHKHPRIEGKFITKGDPYFCEGEIEKFATLVMSGDLEIFCLQISPQTKNKKSNPRLGIKIAVEMLEEINLEPMIYCALRKPFDLTKSFYFNWSKDKGDISYDHFVNFLQSPQLEDSLIIRYLTGLSNGQEIDQEHFDEAFSLLKHCKVTELNNLTGATSEVFESCYGISAKDLKRMPSTNEFNKSFLPNFLNEFNLDGLKGVDYKKENSISLYDYYKGRVYFADKLYTSFIQ